MSIAAVSSAANKLGQLLTHEAGFLYDVNEQVSTLQTKLTTLQSYLEDTDARQETNAIIRNWVADVRETAYDAEDTINTYIIEANDQSPHTSTGVIHAFFSNCFGFFPKLLLLHKVGMDIKKILIRIDDINHRLSTYNIMPNVGGGHDQASSSSTEISRRRQLSRQSYPHDEDEDVIGLEEHITSLVSELTTVNNSRPKNKVVSIIGVGGLGKTTLAKKVYSHPTVKRHFEYRAWISVSRELFSASAILKEIGRQVGAPAFTGVEDPILELRKYLYRKRCFLVFDDLWREEKWQNLKYDLLFLVLSSNNIGGKILLTTRNRHVASTGFTLEPRFLNKEESWKLFCKKAKRDINSISDNLEKVGRGMVEKCGGLPLAIVVLSLEGYYRRNAL